MGIILPSVRSLPSLFSCLVKSLKENKFLNPRPNFSVVQKHMKIQITTFGGPHISSCTVKSQRSEKGLHGHRCLLLKSSFDVFGCLLGSSTWRTSRSHEKSEENSGCVHKNSDVIY